MDEKTTRLFEYLIDHVGITLLLDAAEHARDGSPGVEGPKTCPSRRMLVKILVDLTNRSNDEMPNFGPSDRSSAEDGGAMSDVMFERLRRYDANIAQMRVAVASLSRTMGVPTDAQDTAATAGHVIASIGKLEDHAKVKPTRIHLDVDGVLADWSSAAIRLFGKDPDEVREDWPPDVWDLASVLGVSTNALWRAVDEAGEDFWANLGLFPWAMELYDICQSIAPTTLLTSPSKHPSSLAGKLRWMQTHFGRDFRDFLIGPDKAAAASPASVLIDDRPAGLMLYGDAGGHCILFPAAQNHRALHQHDPLAVVEPELRALFGVPS